MSAADASSLSLWSTLSLLGLILVISGVLLEGVEAFIWTLSWFRRKRFSIIYNIPPEPHIPKWAHRLDHVGWFILVIGLALETWGHIVVTDITGRENRRLTAQLDSTTKTASTNELLSKQLEIRLNEAKTQLATAQTRLNESIITLGKIIEPMNLGDEKSFINAMKLMTGTKVKLRYVADIPAQRTAKSLAQILFEANWQVVTNCSIDDLGEDGIVIGAHSDSRSEMAAQLLLKTLKDRNVPAKITDNIIGAPTNSIIIIICRTPVTLAPKEAIEELKASISNRDYLARNKQIQYNKMSAEQEERRRRISELETQRNSRPTKHFTDEEAAEYSSLTNESQNASMLLYYNGINLEDDRLNRERAHERLDFEIEVEAIETKYGLTPTPYYIGDELTTSSIMDKNKQPALQW